LCGGFNGNAQRAGYQRWLQLKKEVPNCQLEVAGKRGISAFKFRGITPDRTFTNFEDRPSFDEVDQLATRYLEDYATGKLDRLDIVYTKFETLARQQVSVETLLPLTAIGGGKSTGGASGTHSASGGTHSAVDADATSGAHGGVGRQSIYEFLPSPESILEEVVPSSFKIKLFKCFLDAAVSEQIARMVAMKSATENAEDLIKRLSMQYNRARQSRITSELMDVIGGAEAIS
jgi:F-type H+-transporting ATPase subunit gamma